MSSERIKKLCDYMDQNKAKNYPIENAMLYESEDFIKNGYLRMLAVVLQVGNNITEGQLNLYKRIVEGASAENTTEEYMRQAMEIEIQEYTDFVNSCKEEQLRYRFVLDAILLAADGDNKEEQLKFIASFCEDIKMSKEELDYLASMAKAILEQNENQYIDAEVEKNITDTLIEEKIFDGYMSGIWTGKDNIYENEKAAIFKPETIEDITTERLQHLQNSKAPYIKIVGAKIDLKNKKLKFKGKEQVVFENCEFIGDKEEHYYYNKYHPEDKPRKTIYFLECKKIQITNCTFKEFGSRTLYLEKTKKVDICDSKFIKCNYQLEDGSADKEGEKVGGVIYSIDLSSDTQIYMYNTTFTLCGGKNQSWCERSACISNCKVKAVDCTFKQCFFIQHVDYNWQGGYRVKDTYNTMFPPSAKAIRCKFEDSARFN